MKSIKSIEFIFENCEHFQIDSQYFGTFSIDNIKTSINRIACNMIAKTETACCIAVEIFAEANQEYFPFDLDEPAMKFDRILKYNDITSIVLHYENNNTDTYYVDYDDVEEGVLGTENKNQHSILSSLGNLYLVVANDKDIYDFFDKREMDDVESVEFSKKMIMN